MTANERMIRWGVLATGRIAEYFVNDLAIVDGSELVAVGSRRVETATEFATRFGGARPYGSYQELAADPDIDVIYVATPHHRHFDDVMACFEAGKPVLCEKPLNLNAKDSQTLINEARSRGLFFAEAMWTRTNPNIRRMLNMVRSGAIGKPLQVRAQLGFSARADSRRLWDPRLGASALLDVGIHPLTFAYLALGEPTDIVAAGVLSDLGIDVNGGATLTYANGAVASIAWNQVAQSDNCASISGDAGVIEVHPRFNETTGFTCTNDMSCETFEEPLIGEGYAHEIIEVARCLRDGATESALLPPDESLAVMKHVDVILNQLGVRPR